MFASMIVVLALAACGGEDPVGECGAMPLEGRQVKLGGSARATLILAEALA